MSAMCVMLLTLCATVEVTLAPDQPFPYVYVDDPLIVEFLSDVDTDIDANIILHGSHTAEQQEIPLGKIHLHADSEYWYAVHDAPRDRGFYTAEIAVTSASGTSTHKTSFCRIDRPSSLHQIPVYAYYDGHEDACPFPVIHSVGIDTFRCDMDNSHLAEILSKVALFDSNLIVAMPLERAKAFSENDVATIQSQCDNIVRLDISLNADYKEDSEIADVMRRVGCPAAISLVAPNAASFKNQLQQSRNLATRHVTLMTYDWPDISEIEDVRNITMEEGQEGWQIHLLCPLWQPRDNAQDIQFIHRFLQYRSANVSYIGVNATTLVHDTGIQGLMAYLNGLALRFSSTTYVGSLPASASVKVMVFRNASSWFVALWSEKGEEQAVIPVDGAVSLLLTDALGNEITLPEIQDGQITLTAGASPLYLTGTGGIILGRAALNEVSVTAKNITEQEAMKAALAPAVIDLINNIAMEPQGTGSRLRFLDLLRIFPRLEEDWHTKKLSRDIAVPAIVTLAKLARLLCIVEEDRGERFIEPISDTLGRVAELQSLYLTGSAGTAQARKRGDWVLGEVLRLIDEAESLEQAGRKIEASAVAAVAEWRAHCLLYAAQAEQTLEPVPEVQPLILPDATVPDSPEGEIGEGETDSKPVANAEKESEATDQTLQQPEKEEKESGTSADGFHTVKSGDSFYTIAKKYDITIDDLLKWNKLKKNSILRVGQKLMITAPKDVQDSAKNKSDESQEESPGKTAADEDKEAKKETSEPEKDASNEIIHIVKSGDNPSIIANKYKVSLDDFLKWNNLKKRSVLHIGQKLVIRAAE